MNRKKNRSVIKVMGVMLLTIFTIGGCAVDIPVSSTARNVEYTVVASKDIPEEMLEQIEAEKEKEFTLTYKDDAYLYIAKGYGRIENCGCDISVLGLVAQEEVLRLKTEITGQTTESKGQGQDESRVSYPYIVIKTEKTDCAVVSEK